MKYKSIIMMALLSLIITMTFIGCYSDTEGNVLEQSTDELTEINISAAASLIDAMTEIQSEYEKNSNTVILFNFGGSGTLEKQIEQGAPCDLFISASDENMDTLETKGFIIASSRKDLLGNTLTLIASKENAGKITGVESLIKLEVGSISIGAPEAVPAGEYARQSLEYQGVWEQIRAKLVFGKDVKQVLEYVDSGNVDCGLVYKSDAVTLKTGKIICDMPEESHRPIVYPAALLEDSDQPLAAAEFYEFLLSNYAKSVFEKYGFIVL